MIINFCTGFQISSGAFENILKKGIMDNVSLWTCDILWRRSCQVAIAVFLLIMYIQDALVFLRLLVPPFSSPWQHLSPRSLRSLNLMCYWNRVVTRNARDGQTNLIIPAAVELAWAQLWNNPHILCSAESAKNWSGRPSVKTGQLLLEELFPEGHELRSHPSSTWHVNQHQLLPVYKC